MKRDPYRDQANKTRQEISAVDQHNHSEIDGGAETSRLSLHGKKREEKAAQKKPFPLIRVLVGLFVLLPVTVAILSLTFNSSESGVTNATMDRDNTVQVERAQGTQENQNAQAEDPSPSSVTAAEEDEEEEAAEETQPSAETSQAGNESESSEAQEEDTSETTETVQEPKDETVEEPVEEQAEPAAEPEEETTSSATHTVQSSETLYRISVNYFGSGDWVEKIKELNGLSSNEISEGQVLKIPAQ
ncbi:LysM peptidoglycan-binding domain-containing protein [Jeotgalibacillus sp. ET6]|uniref:LysM peptidoglycan-binding domain-containing protein n=1 Tax=Jeotgalibacillus sp. ET6 TaxID=3037260 RepID=UPI002418877D|nr:LysM peptidoglycan-binding domain-containing protein [Jeotgalibacillus sp. ET6]MDG5470672.1 LysM peptidoglycan-binding domain-containing protein [Jeotgalibacillus sp. ET6]